MKKDFVFNLLLGLIFAGTICVFSPLAYSQDGVTTVKLHKVKKYSDNKPQFVSNRLFSLVMPKETKGLYSVKKRNNGITIYDKKSEKAGFGGLAFGVRAYKEPSEHAMLPGGIKIGELTDRKGNLYDMVLYHPTDVQYDYVKGTTEPYKTLYNLGDVVEIKGINGTTYFKNQGMKGETLYKEVLKKHLAAINEKWDSVRLEKENMSYMYNVLASDNKNISDKIGYTYYDTNADGIEELLIGEIADGDWKGVIYDIYTMVNRKPQHVISGGSRNRYFVCNGTFICNEYSSGAKESGLRTYVLVENSTELFPQVEFRYDGYTNKKQPWFIIYSDNNPNNVTEEIFRERKSTFNKYIRFDYIPLSKIK